MNSRFRFSCLLLIASLAGCNPTGKGTSGLPGDAGTTGMADLSMDSDMAFPDLTMGLATYRYVLNNLTLPLDNTQFGIDLNGDNKPDNQLGNIVGVLASQNFDEQTPVSQSISDGTNIVLVRMDTVDPALSDDPAPMVTVEGGKPKTNPNFTGNGAFTVDNAQSFSMPTGALVNHDYTSENPVTTKTPVSLTLKLVLFPNTPPVLFPMHGVHLQFTTGNDAKSGAPGLTDGELQGSVKNTDIQTVLIPGFAVALTKAIMDNPNSGQAMTLEQLFDTGNCTNPNGMQAQAGDNIIDICELATNALIKAVLAPDVQIYDANGNYAPDAHNTTPDSLSMGLGFTAVKATF